MTEPDWSSHLIRCEEAFRKIYPAMLEGKNREAFLNALETIGELQQFMAWCIENKTKG